MSRDRVVSVRLTEQEYEQLQREGRAISDVIRDRPFPAPVLEILPSVTYPQPFTTTVPARRNVIWLTHDRPGTETITINAREAA